MDLLTCGLDLFKVGFYQEEQEKPQSPHLTFSADHNNQVTAVTPKKYPIFFAYLSEKLAKNTLQILLTILRKCSLIPVLV